MQRHAMGWEPGEATEGPPLDTEAAQRALAEVPRGAAWLAGTAVALLLLAWVLIYVAIYIPRGMVG